MSFFSSEKLDKIISDRRLKLEKERQLILKKTQKWLDKYASDYGIKKAYIFGSVTYPNKFHQDSDVDLAVEEINPEKHFLAISLLSTYLEREVDIIKLNQCHFANRICEKGILWMKTP
ncbi:nucleotidyltransferase family protein [Crocosphaera chwakensis]|uniref:Signal peptidase II n=1 Tax=Crocosphaera chwakensis CCY0110 TaxID=391612 RepID=A3INZ4_9CHRO|nr:nucleotidyltransferase domain-containing protein [Crocosphaera chwakensis]EAZ91796.1 signal peptidase II [Crocosphaera chwakensis CCY0110]